MQQDIINNYVMVEFYIYAPKLEFEKINSIPDDLYNTLKNYAEIFGRFSPYEEDNKTGALFDEERIKKEFQKMLKSFVAK